MPCPYTASWTVTNTLLFYFFNITCICESSTILSVRIEVNLCELLAATGKHWKLYKTLHKYRVQDELFKVNNLPWHFQCNFYMFHIQISVCPILSDKLVTDSHKQKNNIKLYLLWSKTQIMDQDTA